MKVFTHSNLDLDAVCSLWAVWKFIPAAKDAKIEFRPADWDGGEMLDGDIAVDINAGGRGIKGIEKDGIVHSCFALLVEKYASSEDYVALEHLVRFVDAQDAHGSAVQFLAPELDSETANTFGFTGINAVLRALQSCFSNDFAVYKRMTEILTGMLNTGRSRARAIKEADAAEIIGDGKVAIVFNSRYVATNYILFERKGVRVIVYVDGYNIGVVRHSKESVRADHPTIRAVVGAEVDEWFAHPSGFLFCRGSRKAPAKGPSNVNPRELAEVIVGLLS